MTGDIWTLVVIVRTQELNYDLVMLFLRHTQFNIKIL